MIARALDADDSDEAAMDRATLDEYRKVLAYLPFEEIEPPAALEERTIEAALARRPAAIPSINRRAKRRATARWVTLGAAVTAAAAVIGFMFVTGNDAKSTPGGRVDLAGAGTEDVTTPILATPGVRKAPLIGDGQTVGQAALTPAGDGALYKLDARRRPAGRSAPVALAGDERQGRAHRAADRPVGRHRALRRERRRQRRHRCVDLARGRRRQADDAGPDRRQRQVLSDGPRSRPERRPRPRPRRAPGKFPVHRVRPEGGGFRKP